MKNETVITHGVQTVCDSHGEWMLPYWLHCLRQHNPDVRVRVVEYGMTPKAIKWAKAQPNVRVIKCPNDVRKLRQETMHTVIKGFEVPWLTKFHIDLDCIVQGDLMPLYVALLQSSSTFAGCGDPYYPWTFRPDAKLGTRFLPIMSGFVLFETDSPVVKDWIEALTKWDSAFRVDGMRYMVEGNKGWTAINDVTGLAGANGPFRDDMQCLSQLYRIGHPDVMEMPAKTQWFRLQADEPADSPLYAPTPDGYLVAHYTGSKGKAMLRDRMVAEGFVNPLEVRNA